MDRRFAGAVAVGGVTGAALRWGIVEASGDPSQWPWGVLVANLVGCAALGLVVGRLAPLAGSPVFAGLTIGFCGALTTFASFAVDLAVYLRADEWLRFSGYLAVSVAGGLAAFLVAYRLGRAGG